MGNKANKAFLIILDGWGHGGTPKTNAIAAAHTPYVDSLYKQYPNAELVTYGEDVGLPDGQMGNSEVGHLNIGAGRVVYQELARINIAIKDKTLVSNPTIKETIAYALKNKKPIHLMGLLSDGGVHSHIDHIIALAGYFSDAGAKVYIHAFLDGRDTGPDKGLAFVQRLRAETSGKAELSTVVGRYYAMDRDNRWERIAKAYDLLVNGKGENSKDVEASIKAYYNKGITDEFMEPIKVGQANEGLIKDKDVVFFANFRTDRPRQLTVALSQKAITEQGMSPLDTYYVTMTQYDKSFKGVKVVYSKDNIEKTLGEVIADNQLKQLRIAETEKYPHVTFFFSGGREEAFEKEERIMVPSPPVATYDLQPEMSAYEMTNKVHHDIKEVQPDFIIMNYANADMVGHTGVFNAAVQAAEVLDNCLEALIPIAIRAEYKVLIIADHGNSDLMVNPDGSPHTAHTTNMVPVIVIDPEGKFGTVANGKLADVAPTILHLMGLDQPKEMTGKTLLKQST